MSELVLIKTSNHPDIRGNDGLPLEAVIGVSAPDTKTHLEYGYTLSGNETEEVMSGPQDTVEAVASFFRQTQGKSPNERPRFTCHSFVAYTHGSLPAAERIAKLACSLADVETTQMQFQPATPYAFIDRLGQHNHSALGIDRPAFSIGVLGADNPLVVCANGLLSYWYNTGHIREIIDIPHQG